jgi:hypothetical protein
MEKQQQYESRIQSEQQRTDIQQQQVERLLMQREDLQMSSFCQIELVQNRERNSSAKLQGNYEEQLAKVREQLSDAQQQWLTEKETFENDIQILQQQHEEAQKRFIFEKEELLKRLDAERVSMTVMEGQAQDSQQQYDQHMSKVLNEHAKLLEALRTQHQIDLNNLSKSYQSEIQNQDDKFQLLLDSVRNEHSKEKLILEENHEVMLENLKLKLREDFDKSEQQLVTKMKVDYDYELTKQLHEKEHQWNESLLGKAEDLEREDSHAHYRHNIPRHNTI